MDPLFTPDNSEKGYSEGGPLSLVHYVIAIAGT